MFNDWHLRARGAPTKRTRVTLQFHFFSECQTNNNIMIKLCPFCDQPFNFNLLKIHIAKIHLGLDNIPCEEPIVETTPVNIKVELSHERVNIKSEPSNEKDKTPLETPDESNVENSISIKHEPKDLKQPPDNQVIWNCEQCGTSFDSINALRVHEEVVHTFSRNEIKHEYTSNVQVEQEVHDATENEGLIIGTDEDNSEPIYFCVNPEQSEPMECDSNYVNLEELEKSNKDQYHCTYCGKAYTNKANCKRHMEVEHEGLRYECIHCGKKLKHRQGLFKHVAKCSVQSEKSSSSTAVQVKNISSSYEVQSKKTSTASTVDAQLNTLRSQCYKMKLFCNELQTEKTSSSNEIHSEKTSSIDQLERTSSNIGLQSEKTSSNVEDLQEENYIDLTDDLVIGNEQGTEDTTLNDVAKDTNEPSKFSCDKCHTDFTSQMIFERHMKLLHNVSVEQKEAKVSSVKPITASLTCGYCGKRFRKKAFLTMHIRVKHKNVQTKKNVSHKYNCDSCEKTFKKANSLWYHKKFNHKNFERYKCNKCDKSYTKKFALKEHIEVKHNNFKYQCDKCDKSYNSSSFLGQHKRIQHGGFRYQCNMCDKSYNGNNALKEHIQVKHNKKLFKCDSCDKSYNSSISLHEHIQVKHNHKLFQCDSCDKSYNSSSALNEHVQVKHNNKMFKCNLCDKIYSSASTLFQHKRVQHSSFRYKCDKCDKTYTQKVSLSDHIESVHENQSSNVVSAQKNFRTRKFCINIKKQIMNESNE